VLAGQEMIRHIDAKRPDGGHAANVRYLWRQIFSVLASAVCEYDFRRLGPVKSQIVVLYPAVCMIQFYQPGGALTAGTTMYLSSALLNIKFPAVTVVRSAALHFISRVLQSL